MCESSVRVDTRRLQGVVEGSDGEPLVALQAGLPRVCVGVDVARIDGRCVCSSAVHQPVQRGASKPRQRRMATAVGVRVERAHTSITALPHRERHDAIATRDRVDVDGADTNRCLVSAIVSGKQECARVQTPPSTHGESHARLVEHRLCEAGVGGRRRRRRRRGCCGRRGCSIEHNAYPYPAKEKGQAHRGNLCRVQPVSSLWSWLLRWPLRFRCAPRRLWLAHPSTLRQPRKGAEGTPLRGHAAASVTSTSSGVSVRSVASSASMTAR